MKTKAKTSMCLHLIVKETLYYSHHGLHLPKLFPWMPVRKSGTSIPRGKFLVSVSSRELKALSWVMRVSHSCRCFLLKAPLPIYLTTAKTSYIKRTGVSVGVVSLKSFLNMFVGFCWTLSMLLSIRLFSNVDVKQHTSLEAPRCVRWLPK